MDGLTNKKLFTKKKSSLNRARVSIQEYRNRISIQFLSRDTNVGFS